MSSDTDGDDHPDADFAAEQNARSAVGAEAYYRVWFDETRALTPLAGISTHGDELESWPFGQ